jgi:serine/threonine protein kinase
MPAAQEGPLLNRRLGDFEIVREVGRGGMGIVYEARQVSLNRKVALKVLAASLGLSGKAVPRFRREAEAAARLHHTNIVPVYATGEQDGVHFYAMELIDGPSLAQVLKQLKQARDGPPAPESAAPSRAELASTGPYVGCSTAGAPGELTSSSLTSGGAYADAVARMVADVAEALEHAHLQGVIHRDIKPSNLLVSSEGRLSVNDFGLARVLEQPGMTLTGEFVGTPAYMSPEQITAGRVPVDHRTDIYSLGATLYEMLTFQPPFRGSSRDQLLAQIIQKEPARPRRLNARIPIDLETICLKCLDKDPDRRYRTARELADDLRRYVNRFAIQAKRAGPFTKMAKWVRRNPALSVAALVLLLAVGIASYFGWHAYQSHQRYLAESRRREEEVRAEKQRAAIERGMVAAMALDQEAAQAAVADAEALGASAGDLHVLRGYISRYFGDSTTAIKEFRAAVELMPDSVAARALLADALGQAGHYEMSESVLKEAEAMPLLTLEDRLFLGHALSTFDPREGLRQLRAAVGKRRSNIGQILLADALWKHASHTGTITDAEESLQAAKKASQLLPRNPCVEVIAVNARLAAFAAYDLVNKRAKAKVYLAEAIELTDAFSGSPDRPSIIETRLMVAMLHDGVTPPLTMTKRLRFPKHIDDPDLATDAAVVQWRLGNLEEARAIVQKAKPTSYPSELKVALALEKTDGRAAAREVWNAAVEPRNDPIMLMNMIPWLYLTGEPERIPAKARKLEESGFRWRPSTKAEWDIMLRFFQHKLSESEFLNAPASKRPDIGWRQMVIGMKRLGEGNREGARKMFEANYKSRTFWSGDYWSCYSFLVRMNSDPEWPRAIPMKKKP